MILNEIYGIGVTNFVFMFFIYSFLGWLWEVFFVFLRTDQLVNRGFLNGPFCPIYGVGATAVILALMPFEENMLKTFIFGAIIATVIEYLAATIMEGLFKTKWWDYSSKKYNIKGRICLSITIGWGLFSVILMKIINPAVMDFIHMVPNIIQNITLVLMTITFTIDFTYTFYYVKKFNKQLEHMSISKYELRVKLENSKLYETNEEIREKLSASENELLIEIRAKIKARSKANTEEFEKFVEEIKEQLSKYNKELKERSFVERRLLKAFPKLKSEKHDEVLKEVMEILNKNR